VKKEKKRSETLWIFSEKEVLISANSINRNKQDTDVQPPTSKDRDEARRLADNPLTGEGALGVTVADVLQVFGGGVVIEEDKPLSCQFCNKKKGVLYTSGWRKGGKIIRRIRADGVHVWACHSCGREVKRSRDSVVTIH